MFSNSFFLNLIMIKIISKIVTLVIISFLVFSCENKASLQQYFVNSEHKSDMFKFDIPANILSFGESSSEETNQTLESIDRLNVIAFKLSEDNEALYLEEKSKVKLILKNKSYRDLFKANTNGIKIIVKYLGTDESMKEVVFYVTDNKKGFALGRLLGDDMRPEKIIKLLESAKDLDRDSDAFKNLEQLFGNNFKT